jgi:Tfp pilus assembly protein PilV
MHTTEKKLRRTRGFGLVEVVITTSIVVIGLLSVASIIVIVMQGNSFSRQITVAATLAHDKIEELRTLNYGSIISGNDTSPPFDRIWSITDNAPETDMKTITVTVNWQGIIHHVEMRTIVRK